MSWVAETAHAGEFLLSIANGDLSFESVTVAAGAGNKLLPGSVLGKITASGKYALLAPTATNGSEVAVGILYAPIDATTADQRAVIIARLAEVKTALLQWPSGITAGQKTTAINELAAKYILARGA